MTGDTMNDYPDTGALENSLRHAALPGKKAFVLLNQAKEERKDADEKMKSAFESLGIRV